MKSPLVVLSESRDLVAVRFRRFEGAVTYCRYLSRVCVAVIES